MLSLLLVFVCNNKDTWIYFGYLFYWQAWHLRQKQRATRAEKLRFQALKADDQEAYMKLVEESKNERLTTLLEKTNDLLARLGAAVKRQKDAEHSAGIEVSKGFEAAAPSRSPPLKNEGTVDTAEDHDAEVDDLDYDSHIKTSDLLEGQRQYNSMVHSEKEEVNFQHWAFEFLFSFNL